MCCNAAAGLPYPHSSLGDSLWGNPGPQKSLLGGGRAAERIATEIHCLSALRHPHIIKLDRVVSNEVQIVLVFEYAAWCVQAAACVGVCTCVCVYVHVWVCMCEGGCGRWVSEREGERERVSVYV